MKTNNTILGIGLILILFSRSWGGVKGKGKENMPEALSGIDKVGSGMENPVKVTIIYDNTVYKKGMEADWGFSCVIEGTEKTILFDTGTKSNLFVRNLEIMQIDPKQIDMVVISHEHGDHTGGLAAFLKMRSDLPVFIPQSFPKDFVGRVKATGAAVQLVGDTAAVCPDVFISGELGDRIKEQSLAVNTKRGLVVICGCSHPGIIRILTHFKETLNRDIYLVLGGFHLMHKTDQEMEDIIAQMKALGVQKCGATHCTGEHQIELFKQAFGADYEPMGVGRILVIE
jgi:7,8-dihydropterin-6-yl-methyl-4-(beta-D-ribofuranosyl)aminobenzene 5'-phosphate synthase